MPLPRVADFLRVLQEDYRAWRRGDRRIAPRFDLNGRPVRGRVYARRTEPSLGALLATGKFKATMRPTGYYSAAEGRWYDIDERGNRTPRKEP